MIFLIYLTSSLKDGLFSLFLGLGTNRLSFLHDDIHAEKNVSFKKWIEIVWSQILPRISP